MEEEESVVHSKVLSARTALYILTIDHLSSLHLMLFFSISVTKYNRAPVSTDPVSTVSVMHSLLQPKKKNWKIKEINVS
jgi:hypothetical protein